MTAQYFKWKKKIIMKNNILMLGFGYVCQYLSNYLLNNGFHIYATSRDQQKIKYWQQSDIHMIEYKMNNIIDALSRVNYVLISIPPNSSIIDSVYSLVKNDFITYAHQHCWVGYLSSTSVYGHYNGEWVDEKSPPKNPGERGLRRLQAEELWLSLYHKFHSPIHIFRLAGIYGPDRNVLTKISHGKNQSIFKENQFFSRIYIDDLSRALYTSMLKPTPGEIYNLADNQPCSTQQVDDYAAHLLGVKPLKRVNIADAHLSAMAKSFYDDSRRVSNKKFKDCFDFQFACPSYKQGLNRIFEDMNYK